MITVTAAVMEQDGKVLIARRRAELAHGECWEFPGGKIQADESPRDCLQRELREELNIEVKVDEHLGTHTHDDGQQQITLMFFRATWVAGAMHLRDHTEVRWVAARRLDEYEFTPGDRWFAGRLRRSGLPL